MSRVITYQLSEEELEHYRSQPKQNSSNIPGDVLYTNNVNIALQSWMKRQGVRKRGPQRAIEWRWPQNR
jgi:hypothetical protein